MVHQFQTISFTSKRDKVRTANLFMLWFMALEAKLAYTFITFL